MKKITLILIILFLSIVSFSQKQTMIGIGTSNFGKFSPNLSAMVSNIYVDFSTNLEPIEYDSKRYNYVTTNLGYNINVLDNLYLIPTVGYFKKNITYYNEMVQGQYQIDHSIIFGAILNIKLNETLSVYGGWSGGLKEDNNIESAEKIKFGFLISLKTKNKIKKTEPERKYYPVKKTEPERKYYPVKKTEPERKYYPVKKQ